jgi:holliday junction DNA helicase RuvA
MISYIQGVIAEKSPTRVVMDVHGIGYEIWIPVSDYDKVPDRGTECKLQTYFHVREEVQQLYGFTAAEERDLFLILISVSGIGPKSAIGILSSVSPQEFKKAVVQENLAVLTAVPGIGRKTAQRLIVEIKEKIAKLFIPEDAKTVSQGKATSDISEAAMLALVSLGYSKAIAEKAIVKALQDHPEKDFALQELIKTALRYAGGG